MLEGVIVIKIGIILGSTRPNRNGEQVARWAYEVGRARDARSRGPRGPHPDMKHWRRCGRQRRELRPHRS